MATTTCDQNLQKGNDEVPAAQPGGKNQRGKLFKKSSAGSENTAAPPLPPRDANATGPKPKALSTVPTKPKNEPMFSDLDLMGYTLSLF
ncbi:jg17099 [Pararge aegeria aegeria]|uniref:Jg17099 protein n=1 Tax=Pararge aegeria aegeria TaxID=348720 RepID=A0A8S4R3F8_9NEOP|nr:jg17099 [Pararge aegeria aegeria]